MSMPKTQKIISGLTLTAFIFSTVILPVNYALAAGGPYEPDPTFDYSDYKINNSSPTDPANTNDNGGSYLGDSNSYNLNISNISQAIPAVIGCTGIVNKVQNSLSKLLSPSSGNTPKNGDSAKGTGVSDSDLIAGTEVQDVPVSSKLIQANTKNTSSNTEEIKKTTAQDKLRDDCINGVAYALAKGQLAKMTQITVNWINSGFSGDPLFLRDRESYFQSIADGQLLNLVGPLASIQNRYIYPFGRSVARSLISSQKSVFEKRAQSTLGKSLKQGATTESFANDFSEGGWDGWFSLTQNDQNNPLGFGIMTSQELADRIAKKEETATAELLEGKGVLSQKKCVDDKYAVNKRADDGKAPDPADNGTLGRECQHWETVTPGSLIQEQASNSLTSSTRQLELADSLNESLSAVFQALVNQMVNKGLSSLSSFSPENAPKNFGGLGSNKLYDSLGNDITNLGGLGGSGGSGNVLSVNKGKGWYNANGDFNITTDLGDIIKVANGKKYVYKKGIISIQKDYGSAAKLSLSALPGIMPALGELDFCIPGPNPSWEGRAKDIINRIIEYLRGLYFDGGNIISPDQSAWSKVAQTAIKVDSALGGQLGATSELIGGIYDILSPVFGGKTRAQRKADEEEQAQNRIKQAEINFNNERDSKIKELQQGFSYYKNLIDPLYGPESPMRTPGNPWFLPMAEAGLEATKYITYYDEDVTTATKDYKDLISQTNANIYKLGVIKGKVDKIVAAAKKRRAAEAQKKGIPMIDPSCYDLDPTQNVNGGGVTGQGTGKGTGGDLNYGPTAGTGTNPKGGVVGSANANTNIPGNNTTQEAVSDFVVTMKEDRATCEATVYGTNKTTGQAVDLSWGLKLPNNPTVFSQKTKDFENTFSTYSQSGSATLTLTVKDAGGKTNSLSKSVIIPQRTLTNKGTTCPQ